LRCELALEEEFQNRTLLTFGVDRVASRVEVQNHVQFVASEFFKNRLAASQPGWPLGSLVVGNELDLLNVHEIERFRCRPNRCYFELGFSASRKGERESKHQ